MACCARFTARADIRVVDVVDNVTTLSICASFSSRFALGVAGNAAVMDGRARFERDRHQNDGIACLLAVLLLASASPARRRLLEQAHLLHQVMVSGVDEDQIHHANPAQLVQLLAEAKASAVKLKLDQRSEVAASITAVLGCDSVLEFEGQVFGKPLNRDEAVRRWRRMRGEWGQLHTGHCLLHGPSLLSEDRRDLKKQLITCVTTRVLFANLTDSEVEAYVASGEPLQCAGGFALEGSGGCCVEQVEGCYSNVIGLSLPLLRRWLSSLDCGLSFFSGRS